MESLRAGGHIVKLGSSRGDDWCNQAGVRTYQVTDSAGAAGTDI